MYYNGRNHPCLFKEEQCIDCKYQKECPVIQLVFNDFLVIDKEFSIINCPFYKGTKPKLKIVR
jgi:hypothetical protein